MPPPSFSSLPSKLTLPPSMSLPPTTLAVSVFALFSISAVAMSQHQQQCPAAGQVSAGFWSPSSSRYADILAINTSLYTHIYYYALALDEQSSPAEVALLSSGQVSVFSAFSSTVKSGPNPSVKTILSVTADKAQLVFSAIAAERRLRAELISTVTELAVANGFDGVDLAWQFPSSAADMANLGALLTEWRDLIDGKANNWGVPLLLTATVYFSNHLFNVGDNNVDYPVDTIQSSLDWVNIVTFGFRQGGDTTELDAPLYDKTSHFSASYGINSWLDAGLPPCKLAMGLPLYGRSWFLKNKAKNGIGAPVVATGPKQRMSNQTGIISYAEIKGMLDKPEAALHYDDEFVSAYLAYGDLWVGFDSPDVVDEKIKFARTHGLLGYFLWPISFDDANYTVSRQASEAWFKYQYLANSRDKLAVEQMAGPLSSPRHGYSWGLFDTSSERRWLPRYLNIFTPLLPMFYLIQHTQSFIAAFI